MTAGCQPSSLALQGWPAVGGGGVPVAVDDGVMVCVAVCVMVGGGVIVWVGGAVRVAVAEASGIGVPVLVRVGVAVCVDALTAQNSSGLLMNCTAPSILTWTSQVVAACGAASAS